MLCPRWKQRGAIQDLTLTITSVELRKRSEGGGLKCSSARAVIPVWVDGCLRERNRKWKRCGRRSHKNKMGKMSQSLRAEMFTLMAFSSSTVPLPSLLNASSLSKLGVSHASWRSLRPRVGLYHTSASFGLAATLAVFLYRGLGQLGVVCRLPALIGRPVGEWITGYIWVHIFLRFDD